MDKTKEIERSKLWNDIYNIVKQIPKKEVDGDAMDASSATTNIEKLFLASYKPLKNEK